MSKKLVEESDFYCPKCGGCGYIGCDGIRSFLKNHVENKTDCTNEAAFIQEIVAFVEETETFALNYPHGDKTKLANDYTTETYVMKNGKRKKVATKNIGTKRKSPPPEEA